MAPSKVSWTFTLKPKPESSRDRLTCAEGGVRTLIPRAGPLLAETNVENGDVSKQKWNLCQLEVTVEALNTTREQEHDALYPEVHAIIWS